MKNYHVGYSNRKPYEDVRIYAEGMCQAVEYFLSSKTKAEEGKIRVTDELTLEIQFFYYVHQQKFESIVKWIRPEEPAKKKTAGELLWIASQEAGDKFHQEGDYEKIPQFERIALECVAENFKASLENSK